MSKSNKFWNYIDSKKVGGNDDETSVDLLIHIAKSLESIENTLVGIAGNMAGVLTDSADVTVGDTSSPKSELLTRVSDEVSVEELRSIILEAALCCNGLHEDTHREGVIELFHKAGFYLDPHDAWCGAFLRSILKLLGLDAPESNLARNFAIGTKMDDPKPGMLAIWKNHCAIVHSISPEIKVIGGNQKDSVMIAPASWFDNYSSFLGWYQVEVPCNWQSPDLDEGFAFLPQEVGTNPVV